MLQLARRKALRSVAREARVPLNSGVALQQVMVDGYSPAQMIEDLRKYQAELAEAIESALELNETAIQQLQLQTDQTSTQDARVTELEGELAEAQARIIVLSQTPDANSAVVITEPDAEGESDNATIAFHQRMIKLNPKTK